MTNRTKRIEKMIREGIDKAILANLLKKREEIKIKETDYSGDFKREAKDIIEHIKDANEEIYIIENKEKKALKTVNKNINDCIWDISIYLNSIIKTKSDRLDDLRYLVSEIIDLTGPKKDSTFLLLNVKRKDFNLIIRHSINVCLISISIAIELTKMMTEKLNDETVKGDFKKLHICNSKIFNREELIKLGISALLHDIGILEFFPDLDENTKFDVKDKSKLELHTNNAYHLLTSMKIDYDIRKAVLQHHELVDGSGYPDGIKGRMMNKYTWVLSFANHFDLLTSKNPFENKLHPHNAIMHILTKERAQYDNDITLAYCRAASLYPIGSWLFLSNDKIGLVFRSNKNNLKRPIIKCVYTSEMKELTKKEFIDLSKSKKLSIKELIDIESLSMLDENIEKYLFDEREFIRFPVNIDGKINIVDTDIFFDSIIKDVSAGGVRVESDSKLKLGDCIFLDFELNDWTFQQIKGIIVWHNENKKECGIRFLNIDEKSKQFLIKTAPHQN